MDREAAIAYVRQNGDQLAQARLQYLLSGTPAPPAVVRELAAEQREDGGWAPRWAEAYSSVDATCYHLSLALQLGLDATAEPVARGLGFLARRQQEDGSWSESRDVVTQAPFWAEPGDERARLYLTANAAYWLAVMDWDLARAQDAGDVLQAHMQPDGRLPSFLNTHWLAAALWHRTGWEDYATRVLEHLETQLHQLSASDLSWLIMALRDAGAPPMLSPMPAAQQRLAELQRPDGSWQAGEAGHDAAHVTVEALRALPE